MLPDLHANGLFDLGFNVVSDQGQVEVAAFACFLDLLEIQGRHHLILVALQQQFPRLQDGVRSRNAKNFVGHGDILYSKLKSMIYHWMLEP